MRKVLSLLFFSISLLSQATTYFIDPSGNDSTGNGTINNPWATLAYACMKVTNPGDIIHVNAGDYFEKVQSVLSVGVSIEGVGITSNIISSISEKYTPTIHLFSQVEGTDGRQYISNLRMDGNNLIAYSAIWVEGRSNVSLHDLTIINFCENGITFNGGSQYLSAAPTVFAKGNKFYNSTVSNCSAYTGDDKSGNGKGALQIGGQDGLLIYNNILNQTQRAVGDNGYLIKYYSNGFCKGVKIFNNTIIKAPYDGYTWDFAIELWNTRGGIEIYNNEIQGSIDIGGNLASVSNDEGGYGFAFKIYNNVIGQESLRTREEVGIHFERAITGGIYVNNNLFKNLCYPFLMYQGNGDAFKDLYVYNNIFNNIGISGQPNIGNVCNWGTIDYSNITYDNINFVNNTISGNSDGGTPINGLRFTFKGKATNVSLKNNIILGFAVYPIYIEGSTIDNLSIENNLYYDNGINDEGISEVTLTNLTNQNNKVGDPQFVSSSDFHLMSKSPGIGAGVSIAYISTDYEGKQVSNPPNLGCYSTVAGIPNPSYTGSSVANNTPSILEMSYNLTLANIVPEASAFNVLVNSVARSVTTVSVSGTKVLLTLSSPVEYGNSVTVAYSAPASNPLQTPAGGLAASITAQNVTNRINPPPAIPVFIGATVENTAPSVIEMTYDLTLANIVPSASAFQVSVNSAARVVNSVTVSGTKVILTLATPVAYGDNVTVAYTKPSASYLQTSSGGQAVSISAQTVTNKVNAVVVAPPVVVIPPAVVNTPPVVIVNYISPAYSGFVGVLDATGSYDANKDNLTFAWKVQDRISVSAINNPVIEFLAPVVDAKRTYEFVLTVSDGKATESKTIPVEILPYKPEMKAAEVMSVEASDFQSPYSPYNIIDGNIGTMWSAIGDDQWIIMELKGSFTIQHIKLAFQPGQNRESYFDIYGSNDKVNWEPILIKSRSCAFSGDLQVFDFPASKTGKEFRYIKLVGQGNSVDSWNYISEFRIFGNKHKNPPDYEEQIVKIYPNPAHQLVNVLIDEQSFMPDFIQIVSLTGKVIYNDKIDPGIRQFQIPVDFKQGIYIIQMGTGDITLFTQKLIVSQ